jgi:hypothetical protein
VIKMNEWDMPTAICQNCIHAEPIDNPEYEYWCKLNNWEVNENDDCEDGEYQ